MKKLLLLTLILLSKNSFSQDQGSAATDAFRITGKVKTEKVVTMASLHTYPTTTLSDINISCSPKKEEKAKQVKGVLLKSILDSVAFQYEKPRMLNHYYFLFVAADGYKMVFSFNEIYNTEVGNNLYLVTEIEGKGIKDMSNRILLLSTKDIKSGSRNMKWLSEIVVCNASAE
jgi:hypothetical protein